LSIRHENYENAFRTIQLKSIAEDSLK